MSNNRTNNRHTDRATLAGVNQKQNAPEATKKPFSRFGKQEIHVVKDEEGNVTATYKFQFPGVLMAQQIVDSAVSNQGTIDRVAYYKNLMKYVIVEPVGIDFEYWNTHDGYSEVLEAADNFLGEWLNR